MKKTYIAPQMEVITLHAESMLAASDASLGVQQDSSINDEANYLSTGKTGWDSESWNTED